MSTQFNAQNIKKRLSLLVFIKGSTAPLVLYSDETQAIYDELNQLLRTNQVVLVEKETTGPLKKVCFWSNQIAAIALQEEQYV